MPNIYKNTNDYAISYQKRTPVLSGSQQILSTKGTFIGIFVKTDGTNDVTISLYDSLAGIENKIMPTLIIKGTDNNWALDVSPGLLVLNGIYAVVTTSGTCEYQIYYNN